MKRWVAYTIMAPFAFCVIAGAFLLTPKDALEIVAQFIIMGLFMAGLYLLADSYGW